ncbi:hypothetical protein JCM8202v2_004150 [Rhodotorula sphaerocarpa]
MTVVLPLLAALAPLVNAGYSWYNLGDLPHTSEAGQTGYNDCGTNDSPNSMCQTSHVNSVTDFCLWAPPTPGGTIGDTEEIEVAWCTASGHGARVMPEGTVHSAHFLTTPHYTQVTGTGDFTKINIQGGDAGGELDPHGATGFGNPIGSLVFSNGQQIHEWTSISDSEFCFRICHDAPDAWLWCQHIYDLQGCAWNEPGNYGGGFDTCEGDSTEYPPGVYNVNGQLSTYQQSQGPAPTAHAAGASSNCQAVATVGGAAAAYTPEQHVVFSGGRSDDLVCVVFAGLVECDDYHHDDDDQSRLDHVYDYDDYYHVLVDHLHDGGPVFALEFEHDQLFLLGRQLDSGFLVFERDLARLVASGAVLGAVALGMVILA